MSSAGGSIASFLDNYYRATTNARAEEQLARQNALAQLQATKAQQDIATGERQVADRADLAEGIARVMASGAPPAPPVLDTGIRPEAFDAPGPTPPTPAMSTPFEGVPMTTALAGLSPNQQMQVMSSPGGQNAMKAAGVVSNADFAANQRWNAATKEAKRHQQAALDAILNKDIVGNYAASLASIRTLMDAAPPDKRAAYEQMAKGLEADHRQWVKKKVDDKEAYEMVAADKQAITAADLAHRANPTPATRAARDMAIANAKSPDGQKFGFDVLKAGVVEGMKRDNDPVLIAQNGIDAVRVSMMGKMGANVLTHDQEVEVIREYRRQQPGAFAAAFREMSKDKDGPPSEMQIAMYGRAYPKNVYQAATDASLAQGYAFGSKEQTAAFLGAVKVLEEVKHRPAAAPRQPEYTTDAGEIRRLTGLRKQFQTDITTLRNQFAAAMSKDRPTIQAKIDGAEKQRDGIDERLRELGVRLDPTEAPDPRTQPKKPGGTSSTPPEVRKRAGEVGAAALKDKFPGRTVDSLTEAEMKTLTDEVNRRLKP